MRRLIAFSLSVLLAFSSVITPARAFAPVAVLAAPQVVTAGGSYAVAALAGMIGLAGLYLNITDSEGNSARLPLADNEASKPPAPAAPSTATGSPGPNTSQMDTMCQSWADYKMSSGGCGTTWQRLYTPNGLQYYCRLFYPGGGACYESPYSTIPQTTTCPAGYTLSGSTCTLSNPRKAAPDKKCDLQFSAGKYLYYDDSDCPSGPSIDHSKAVPGLRSDGDVVFVPGRDSSGNPLLVKVLQQRDNQTGAVTERVLEVYKQSGANVEKTTVSLSPSAQVQSVSTTTSPGTLTSPQTSPSASTTPDSATTTPTAQTDPTKPPVVETCGLPGKPACVIDDTGFTGKDAFLAPKQAEISTEADKLKTGIEALPNSKPEVGYSWLPSLMPGTAVACQPLQLSLGLSHGPLSGLNHSENLDICDKLDIARQVFGYLLFLMTVFYVWRAFSRSNEGQ